MRSLVLTAALFLGAAPAMAQNVGQMIDVGGWKVQRVQGDAKVQTCIAMIQGDDKTAVGFGGTSQGQALLMLIDGTGKLKPNSEIALQYKVDKGKTVKVAGTAVNATTIVALLGTLSDVAPFFTAVEVGNNIHLETPDYEFDYSLSGSKAALAALEKCIIASMAN